MGVLGFAGWRVIQNDKGDNEQKTTTTQQQSSTIRQTGQEKLDAIKAELESAGFKERNYSNLPTDFTAPDKNEGHYFVQDLNYSFQGYGNTGFDADVTEIKGILTAQGLASTKGEVRAEPGVAYYANDDITCGIDPRMAVSHIDCNLNSTIETVYANITNAAAKLPSGKQPVIANGSTYTVSDDKSVIGIQINDINFMPHFVVNISQGGWQYVGGATEGTAQSPSGLSCTTLDKSEYKSVFKTSINGGFCQ